MIIARFQDSRLTYKRQLLSYMPAVETQNLKLKTIPFTLAPPKVTYLGMNLTKYLQDLYEKNYKTLMKVIKEELNKWRDSSCSWIGRLNIVNILVLSNLIYRFKATSIKISTSYFVGIDKLILKFIWRGKSPRIATSILKEKNNQRTDTT